MEKSLVLKQQSELVLREMENTFLNIRNMDISSRGYAIMQEDRFLFLSVEDAHKTNQRNFQRLDSLLDVQGFSDPENYEKVKEGFQKYAQLYGQMVSHLKQGNFEEYKKLLSEDYGKQF